jgi:hypothetical protein
MSFSVKQCLLRLFAQPLKRMKQSLHCLHLKKEDALLPAYVEKYKEGVSKK